MSRKDELAMMNEKLKFEGFLFSSIFIIGCLIGIVLLDSSMTKENSIATLKKQVDGELINKEKAPVFKHIQSGNEDVYEYKNMYVFSGEQLKTLCIEKSMSDKLKNFVNPPKDNMYTLSNIGGYSFEDSLKETNSFIYKLKSDFAKTIQCEDLSWNEKKKELYYKKKPMRITLSP